MKKKAMVYIQSGGPTAVINTSLYGAIMEAKLNPDRVSAIYGSRYGIEGLINDNLVDLNQESLEEIELLKQTPGAALGSTRYKLPKDFHSEEYLKIIQTIKKHDIGYVFVNGGNDSMDTCHKLSLLCKELGVDCQVIGVPKTVDNDLASTDHSVGFPSAAKHVINTFQSIAIDAMSYRKSKVYIVEIMGRNAGWLSASVDLLDEAVRPDLMYLPESKFDLEDFLGKVKAIYERKGYCIVALSEGVTFNYDGRKTARVDTFGHAQLGGIAHELGNIIEMTHDYPIRSIELSLMQRADPVFVSLVDQNEAEMAGRLALRAALEGETGVMVGIIRGMKNGQYESSLELQDISKVANAEAFIPENMLHDDTRMSDKYREYLRPLIQGEVVCAYENGILKRAKLKYIKVK